MSESRTAAFATRSKQAKSTPVDSRASSCCATSSTPGALELLAQPGLAPRPALPREYSHGRPFDVTDQHACWSQPSCRR